MTELLTIEHFRPYVGKRVTFRGMPYAFMIDRLEGGATPVPAGWSRSSFVVIFSGPSKTDVMPTGLYECEMEGGSVYTLHIMPIYTPQPDCQEYQAAFN
jgi:hypothetical protein